MNTIVLDDQKVRVPTWVDGLDSFRRWLQSDAFPEDGRICYLNGDVWIDMSREQIFSQNQVKSEISMVVGVAVKQQRAGRYFPDGVLVSNAVADLSSQPDGVFVSEAAFQSGRVRLVACAGGGFVELDGSPDMVLEVVSTSSVEKDTVILLDLYWRAGIREYWLVDARDEDNLRFDIFRHSPTGFVPTRRRSGWLKSNVFGRSFRLTRTQDPLGHPEFTLEMR